MDNNTDKLIQDTDRAIVGLWDAINSLSDTIDKAKQTFNDMSDNKTWDTNDDTEE